MQQGVLKHYSKYLKSLTMFALALDIEIVWKPYDENACWVPSRNRIIIDDALCDTDAIASILHELGHAMADCFYTKDKLDRITNKAYSIIYTSKKLTDDQLTVIIATEQEAWDLGRKIAKILKIRLGKWYDLIEKECVQDYKES